MTDPLQGAATEADIAEVEHQFGALIQRVRSRWRQLAQQVHPELQPMGYKILTAVNTGGPTTASRLVEELATDKSVLSRQIAQLERLGLLERQVDGRDGRVRTLALTEQAAVRLQEVQRFSQAEWRRSVGEWPAADVRELARLLQRLSRA